MSVYSSGPCNDTIVLPSVNVIYSGLLCLSNKLEFPVFITFTITSTLLLFPLLMLILYLGFQRWRQHSPTSTAASHSDAFTYHLVTMEMTNVIACILCCCGIYMNILPLLFVWYCLFCFVWYGETFFYVVTCVEHYLAVVHPITYIGLRQEKGIWIRNIVIGSIWLLSFGGMFLNAMKLNTISIEVCMMCSSVVIISFCSLSVLWVLVHPGPGEQGKDQRMLTQSKQRAFYTIVAILGALMVRCVFNIAWSMFSMLGESVVACSWVMVEVWCNVPSSLVLPVLFLHRAGKLTCCRNNNY